ncbi:claudin-15-like isoform X2 [Pezoporus flaviventris]|uniref:claudin-15-like isoform X2 n=1 Tax=Pezoporus flaviventris TaxID=889875 RepID=UPI002AAF44D2|nr:claudin-15-like isoform X2 [Pezoporus flaviventris]
MTSTLEIVSFLLCLGGLATIGATLPNDYWKVSSLHGSVITTTTLFENLWKSCAQDSTGVSNCRDFDSLLALPAYIQACRALMIASILLGFIAAVLSLLGLKCTKIGLSDEDGKTKFAVTGGFLFILGGLCSMVAVSWYAAMITAQFFDPLYAGTKYELGDALYLGWAGSVLCMLGGILLTCSCKGKKKQDYSFNKYPYSAGHAAPHQDAYTKNSETVISNKEYV